MASGTAVVEGHRISGPSDTRAPARIEGLDGIRALAAGAVVVFHVLGSNDFHAESIIGPYTNRLGNLGVAQFLLLSGFLLYLPFVRANLADQPVRSFQGFWWRRFLRIYPAYWVVYFVQVVFFDINRPDDAEQALTHVFLLGNYLYDGQQVFEGLEVAWTLCLEMSFYLLLPVIAWLVRRVGSPRTSDQKLRNELLWVAAIVAMGPIYRSVGHALDFSVHMTAQWIPAYGDWFGMGMLLAVLRAHVENGGTLPPFLEVLRKRPVVPLLLGLAIFAATAHIGLPLRLAPVESDSAQLLALFNPLAALMFLLPVALSVGSNKSWLITPLRHPLMVWFGTISFGIYLWHQVLNRAYMNYLDTNNIEPNMFAQFVVISIATVLLAHGLHHLIERPIQQSDALRRLSR